ncbi:hypothetical protein KIPB_003579 [Kipferlia bialata]|uniref:Uncharacterized protein n=1 Tax=Kipferlia bialata TaxID=797122 RepID=A0A9K3GHC8_9EUKA|nr:hypothetical protein KIPB_003579 [Kipferlia bialata]|eukprot:g3579.t1
MTFEHDKVSQVQGHGEDISGAQNVYGAVMVMVATLARHLWSSDQDTRITALQDCIAYLEGEVHRAKEAAAQGLDEESMPHGVFSPSPTIGRRGDRMVLADLMHTP